MKTKRHTALACGRDRLATGGAVGSAEIGLLLDRVF